MLQEVGVDGPRVLSHAPSTRETLTPQSSTATRPDDLTGLPFVPPTRPFSLPASSHLIHMAMCLAARIMHTLPSIPADLGSWDTILAWWSDHLVVLERAYMDITYLPT